MSKLSNVDKARIFSLYASSHCWLEYEYLSNVFVRKLCGVIIDANNSSLFFTFKNDALRDNVNFNLSNPILFLKPLSMISEEDAIEVAKLEKVEPNHILRRKNGTISCVAEKHYKAHDSEEYYPYGEQIQFNITDFQYDDGGEQFNFGHSTTYQFLMSKGYSVSIYPWNKTPIELGIAKSIEEMKV